MSMHTVNSQLQATSTTVALSQNSSSVGLDRIQMLDVTAVIADVTPSDKTFDTGTMDVKTFTFPAVGAATDGDNIIFYDAAGVSWGIAIDTTGLAAAEPSYAAWTAIPAGRKVYFDGSLAATAALMAAAAEAAVDALTGFTAVITTDDSAANGTMLFTQVVPGVVTAANPANEDDSGAGTITVANTTPGVATEVDLVNNTVTIPSHGYATGTKITALTTTGTLPAGLSTGTVYYVIAASTDTIKFATTQALAFAGTAENITDYGTTAAVHTVDIAATVAGTIKLQKNNNPPDVTAVFVDLTDEEIDNGSNSQTISAAGTKNWALYHTPFRELRAVVAVTSGAVTCDIRAHGKG